MKLALIILSISLLPVHFKQAKQYNRGEVKVSKTNDKSPIKDRIEFIISKIDTIIDPEFIKLSPTGTYIADISIDSSNNSNAKNNAIKTDDSEPTATVPCDVSGINFNSIGPLTRRRLPNSNMHVLAYEKPQVIAFDICINRIGDIIYTRFNFKQSKTKDIAVIKKASILVREWKFEEDISAPEKECGVVKIKINGKVN
jgi:hypothetical protein